MDTILYIIELFFGFVVGIVFCLFWWYVMCKIGVVILRLVAGK
jgi:hypothetical protein